MDYKCLYCVNHHNKYTFLYHAHTETSKYRYKLRHTDRDKGSDSFRYIFEKKEEKKEVK